MDLESAIPIPCPFVDAMAYGGIGGVAAVITLALVGIDPCAASRHVFGNQVVAGSRVCMITHPETLLTRLPQDHTDNGWVIVGVSEVPYSFMGTPAERFSGVAVGRTFFPRRSGTVRPPRKPSHPSPL